MLAAAFIATAPASFWMSNLWPGGSGPAGVTVAVSTTKAFVATVIAPNDAVQSFACVHSLGAATTVFLEPVPGQGYLPFYTSQWRVAGNVSNLVTVSKIAATGSGSPAPQLIVTITP